jgi:putative MATE family efflux protein
MAAANEGPSPAVKFALEGPAGRVIWKLSAPNVVSNALITLVTIFDAFFVAQLGTTALASLALVFPFQMLMQMFGNGAMGGGIASALSRALGRRDTSQASALAWHALLIGVTMSVFFVVVFGFFAQTVFTAMGGSGESLDGAIRYAHIAFGGATASWLFFTLFAICRGAGDMRAPALALMIATAAQISLSASLTLGLGVFPSLGVLGPAVALVVCQGATGIGLLIYVMRGRLAIQIKPQRPRWAPMADILRVGGLSMVNSVTIVLAVVVVTAVIGRYGVQALGGYGLGSRLELMLVPIAFGIGGALTTAVGLNIGAGQHARARSIALLGGGIAFGVFTPIGVALAIWPGLWLSWFTAQAEPYQAGANYLQIVAPFYGVFVAGQVLYFASQGTGKMLLPVLVGFARLVVVTFTCAVTVWLGLGLDGIFWGVSAGMMTVGIGLWLCTKGPAWRIG